MEFIIVLILFFGIFMLFWIASNKEEIKSLEKPKPIEQEPPKIENKPTITPTKERIKSSYILTYHEQAMFKLLKQALPNHHIFVQVSFSAILWTPDQGTRNRFNRKIADFVITCENFLIIAIIELDDVSHIGREDKDAERDAFLITAGYKVIRYKQLPTIEQIKNDIIL